MSRKRKVRIDRIIILLLAMVIVFGLVFFGVVKLLELFDKDNGKPGNVVDPQPVETNEDVKVSLEDYEVYKDDTGALGFDFIIAEMRFTSNKPISFDLSNLQTSEKIYLNNVSKYVNTLSEKGYRTSKLNFVDSVVSSDKDYRCKIFIPYTTTSSSLRLLNSLDASMIEFDLTKNNKDLTTLKFDTPQDIEVGNTNVSVSSCSISTMMLHNGEEYQVPSTMNVYTFRINVKETDENVRITDAKFVRASNDEVIQCMDGTYESEKVSNCLGKELVVGDNGALFFETAVISDSPDYDGFLMLMFSNSSEWVKIPTTLE